MHCQGRLSLLDIAELSNIPDLYTLDASSTPTLRWDNQKCPQTLPDVPLGGVESPWIRMTDLAKRK